VNYNKLSNGQLCNHFLNNQELTTKTGLVKTLSKLSNSEEFFPRCYDFTDESQIKEFVNDFYRTGVINLLKKHALLFIELHKVKKELSNTKNLVLTNIIKSIYLPFNCEWKMNLLLMKIVKVYIKRHMYIVDTNKYIRQWLFYATQAPNLLQSLQNISTLSLPYTKSTHKLIGVSL
jgi:hypothetical protein